MILTLTTGIDAHGNEVAGVTTLGGKSGRNASTEPSDAWETSDGAIKSKEKRKVFGLIREDIAVHPILLLIQFVFSFWHVLGEIGNVF